MCHCWESLRNRIPGQRTYLRASWEGRAEIGFSGGGGILGTFLWEIRDFFAPFQKYLSRGGERDVNEGFWLLLLHGLNGQSFVFCLIPWNKANIRGATVLRLDWRVEKPAGVSERKYQRFPSPCFISADFTRMHESHWVSFTTAIFVRPGHLFAFKTPLLVP